MLFESLNESADNDELIILYGGMCRFHLRRDGQLTIREILVLPGMRGYRIGARMLQQLKLKRLEGARCIVARCPADLPANGWYARMGFVESSRLVSKAGREIIAWRLDDLSSSSAPTATLVPPPSPSVAAIGMAPGSRAPST
jgi:GNAT superfamily N-acetyltransferase